MEHRQLALAVEFAFVGYQLDNLDSCERPLMRLGAGLEFLRGFGQRDVKAALPGAYALLEKLKCKRGLTGTGIAVDEIEPRRYQATVQNLIKAGDPGFRT